MLRSRPTLGWFVDRLSDLQNLEQWHGACDAAQEQKANLVCFVSGIAETPAGFNAQANILYDLAHSDNIDGVSCWTAALMSHWDTAAIERFYAHYALPGTTIGIRIPESASVLLDNYRGVYDAMTHLLDAHKLRRIAFICGPEEHQEAQARYRGYAEALAAYNIELDQRIVAPGTFNPYLVQQVVQAALVQLFDNQSEPVEAIVSATAAMALEAIKQLRERGIQVPRDVAVIGFDDFVEAEYNTPPLTTVRQPHYAMGQQAVTLLLSRIKREPVPEETFVPPELIIRQSCGCCDEIVLSAAADGAPRSPSSPNLPVAEQRDRLQAELLHLTEHVSGTATLSKRQAEALVNALLDDIGGHASGNFLMAFETILQNVMSRDGDIHAWHAPISLLRRIMLGYISTPEELERAGNLWQQARVLISSMTKHSLGYQRLRAEQNDQRLREIGQLLITTFELEGLLDILAEHLPRLGIPGAYLALYESPQPYTYPQPVPEWSHLLLAYHNGERIAIQRGGRRFPTHCLLPDQLLPDDALHHLVVEPLYFRDRQLGFIVFEVGPRDGKVYDILRGEISSALQGALLVGEIKRQQYILDTFMDNVPDSIYFKDRESRFTRINTALADLLELDSPEDAVGKTDFDMFPAQDARAKYEQEQTIIRSGEPILALEEPDAGERWSLTTKMPLRDEHGDIIGTFGISRDITAMKHAQTELQRAYSEISALNNQLTEENIRMSAELDVAQRLQKMILPAPQELREIQGLDIVGFMQPADEVGGDYYDVLFRNGMLHIGIGDVTGHGLESGVLMLMAQTTIRALIEHGETDPIAFVKTLNRTIYKNADRMGADKTLTFAMLHYQHGQLKIVGQHEELLIVRRGGHVERLDTINLGFPIGLEVDIDRWIKTATVVLQPGDASVLYTDGITEAENTDKELYGLNRLCNVLSQQWDQSAERMKQAVIDDVLRHIGSQQVFDDLTLVIVKQQ